MNHFGSRKFGRTAVQKDYGNGGQQAPGKPSFGSSYAFVAAPKGPPNPGSGYNYGYAPLAASTSKSPPYNPYGYEEPRSSNGIQSQFRPGYAEVASNWNQQLRHGYPPPELASERSPAPIADYPPLGLMFDKIPCDREVQAEDRRLSPRIKKSPRQTFLLGQSVPIDPYVIRERERKRRKEEQLKQEQLEQIEENRKRKEQEKERIRREDEIFERKAEEVRRVDAMRRDEESRKVQEKEDQGRMTRAPVTITDLTGERNRSKAAAYQEELKAQMAENALRKRLEKEKEAERERREEEANKAYFIEEARRKAIEEGNFSVKETKKAVELRPVTREDRRQEARLSRSPEVEVKGPILGNRENLKLSQDDRIRLAREARAKKRQELEDRAAAEAELENNYKKALEIAREKQFRPAPREERRQEARLSRSPEVEVKLPILGNRENLKLSEDDRTRLACESSAKKRQELEDRADAELENNYKKAVGIPREKQFRPIPRGERRQEARLSRSPEVEEEKGSIFGEKEDLEERIRIMRERLAKVRQEEQKAGAQAEPENDFKKALEIAREKRFRPVPREERQQEARLTRNPQVEEAKKGSIFDKNENLSLDDRIRSMRERCAKKRQEEQKAAAQAELENDFKNYVEITTEKRYRPLPREEPRQEARLTRNPEVEVKRPILGNKEILTPSLNDRLKKRHEERERQREKEQQDYKAAAAKVQLENNFKNSVEITTEKRYRPLPREERRQEARLTRIPTFKVERPSLGRKENLDPGHKERLMAAYEESHRRLKEDRAKAAAAAAEKEAQAKKDPNSRLQAVRRDWARQQEESQRAKEAEVARLRQRLRRRDEQESLQQKMKPGIFKNTVMPQQHRKQTLPPAPAKMPEWGIQQPKAQFVKMSERDPNYKAKLLKREEVARQTEEIRRMRVQRELDKLHKKPQALSLQQSKIQVDQPKLSPRGKEEHATGPTWPLEGNQIHTDLKIQKPERANPGGVGGRISLLQPDPHKIQKRVRDEKSGLASRIPIPLDLHMELRTQHMETVQPLRACGYRPANVETRPYEPEKTVPAKRTLQQKNQSIQAVLEVKTQKTQTLSLGNSTGTQTLLIPGNRPKSNETWEEFIRFRPPTREYEIVAREDLIKRLNVKDESDPDQGIDDFDLDSILKSCIYFD